MGKQLNRGPIAEARIRIADPKLWFFPEQEPAATR